MPATTAPDPWELFGLQRDASDDEVRAAYRAAARSAHPDAGGSDALFRMVSWAYEQVKSGARPDPGPSRPPRQEQQGERPARGERISKPSGPVVGTAGSVSGRGLGANGEIGAIGEVIVADRIATSPALPDRAILLNGLRPEGTSDMDHVVLLDDVALFVDTKTWSTGTYSAARDGSGVLLDGAACPHASLRSTLHMRDVLADYLDLPLAAVTTIVAVTDRAGSSSDHSIGFSVRGVDSIVGVDDLDAAIGDWVASSSLGELGVPVRRLRRAMDATDGVVVHPGQTPPPSPPGPDAAKTRRSVGACGGFLLDGLMGVSAVAAVLWGVKQGPWVDTVGHWPLAVTAAGAVALAWLGAWSSAIGSSHAGGSPRPSWARRDGSTAGLRTAGRQVPLWAVGVAGLTVSLMQAAQDHVAVMVGAVVAAAFVLVLSGRRVMGVVSGVTGAVFVNALGIFNDGAGWVFIAVCGAVVAAVSLAIAAPMVLLVVTERPVFDDPRHARVAAALDSFDNVVEQVNAMRLG